MEAPSNIGDYDSNQMQAWFIAPEDTKYKFYMTCDDNCELHFSNVADSTDVANVKKIISQNYFTPYRNYFDNQTRTGFNMESDWITLQKGKKYYIDARHSESIGSDHLTVGVEIEKADTTGHHHAMKEVQEIGVLTTRIFEEFTVTVDNPDDGIVVMAFRSPTNQTMMPQKQMKSNSNANEFKTAIRDYFIKQVNSDVDVTLVMTDASEAVTTDRTLTKKNVYKVTLQKLIDGVAHVGNPSFIKVSS